MRFSLDIGEIRMFHLNLDVKGHYMLRGLPAGCSVGVTGRAVNRTDYTAPDREIRVSDKELLSSVTGIPSDRILMLDQVHGDTILHIDACPEENLLSAGEADGMITSLHGLCLVIRTADCVPVLLYDPVNSIIGAVHSGWKGTMLDITGKCITEMTGSRYGSKPENILVFILPSIGPGSYEVNHDVAKYFEDDTIKRNGRLYVDLWGGIEKSCSRNGIIPENMYNARICNRIHHDEFFSYRYGDRGRNLNFIYMNDR